MLVLELAIRPGNGAETNLVEHRIMVPVGVSGAWLISQLAVSLLKRLFTIEQADGSVFKGTLMQMAGPSWASFAQKLIPVEPLVTGQRVIDTFVPVTKGGAAAALTFRGCKTVTSTRWPSLPMLTSLSMSAAAWHEMTDVLTNSQN